MTITPTEAKAWTPEARMVWDTEAGSFLKEEIAQLISLLDKLFGKGAFAESIRYLQELVKNS